VLSTGLFELAPTGLVTSVRLSMFSRDTAVVRHILSIEGSNEGQSTSISARVTPFGFQKQGGKLSTFSSQGVIQINDKSVFNGSFLFEKTI